MDLSRYLDLFVDESREHIAALSEILSRAQGRPDASAEVQSLFRHLHSLKGMAASMGFGPMRELAHAAEHLLSARRAGGLPADAGDSLLVEATACLERLVDRARRGEPVDDEEAPAIARRLREIAGAADPGGNAGPSPAPRRTTWRAAVIVRRDRPFPALRAAAIIGSAARLGRIVGTEPSMAALRSGAFEGRLVVVLDSALGAAEVGSGFARMEDVDTFSIAVAPPAPALPPKPPPRFARVPVAALDRLLEEADSLVREQARSLGGGERAASLARRLRRGLTELRLVPFETVAGRIERAAEDLARALGKKVDVRIEGAEVRLDRALLDAAVDPLLHLVRNALDHGIELPGERTAAGKPEAGSLHLRVARDGERVRVEVEDDGRGVAPENVDRIFAPGFTTTAVPNEVSGRGVGLDAVSAAAARAGGRVEVRTTRGAGSCFTLVLPLAVASLHALLVRAGGSHYALPAAVVQRVEAPGGGAEPDAVLEEILGIPLETTGAVVTLRSPRGLRRLGVPEALGRVELRVFPVRGPLRAAGRYGGAALLEDDRVVLVLDPGV